MWQAGERKACIDGTSNICTACTACTLFTVHTVRTVCTVELCTVCVLCVLCIWCVWRLASHQTLFKKKQSLVCLTPALT